MRSTAGTVADYLDGLPPDRRAAIEEVRRVILASLPPGFEEGVQSGMICYEVPLARLPDTYNGKPLPLACLGSQKNHMALYLMCTYSDPALLTKFENEYKASGKRLDMGKSCVRFRSVDDLPLDVIGRTIGSVAMDDYVTRYRDIRAERVPRKAAPKKAAPKRAAPAKKAAPAKRAAPAKKAGASRARRRT